MDENRPTREHVAMQLLVEAASLRKDPAYAGDPDPKPTCYAGRQSSELETGAARQLHAHDKLTCMVADILTAMRAPRATLQSV